MVMDIDRHIANLKEGGIIPESDLRMIVEKVKEILMEESNVQPVSSPVTVCGDIHGQFYDLLELFSKGGNVPETKYIFMGDYVDRGFNSVETFELLICLKLKHPDSITLLRGNHECRQTTTFYGFYDECLKKYGSTNVWKYCTDLFDYLNISCLIDERILCIHGGLSPDVKTIDQIRTIDRRVEIPHEGAFCDLMWSDPDDIETWHSSPRGAGYIFGSKVTQQFNHINDLELICRAHQLVQEGHKYWFEDQSLITVWSAPNYFNRCGNIATIMQFDAQLNRSFIIFDAVPQTLKSVNPRQLLPYFL